MENKKEYKILSKDDKRLRLGNIFSVKALENDLFEFREECDQWHEQELTKEEVLLMIKELKFWIENNNK